MDYVKTLNDVKYALDSTVEVQRQIKPTSDNHYISFEHLVQQHGITYPTRRLPLTFRRRPLGYCFRNAYEIAHLYGLDYVEGIAATGLGLTLHAWNLKNGQVVDSTWESIYYDPDAREYGYPVGYIGITIPFPVVELATDLHGYHGVFDDYYHGYPILHYPLDWSMFENYLQNLLAKDENAHLTFI